VIGPHCPPGPLGKKCRDEKAAFESSQHQQGDTTDASSSSSSSSTNNNHDNEYDYDSYSDANSSSNNDGSSSSSSSKSQTPNTSHYIKSNKSRILSITLACVAGSAALAAMIVGSRRYARSQRHPLHGIINQRIQLFNNFKNNTKHGPSIHLPEDEDTFYTTRTSYQLV